MATKKSTPAKSTPAKTVAQKAPAKAAAKTPATSAPKKSAPLRNLGSAAQSLGDTAAAAPEPKAPASHHQIAERAHQLFVSRGHQHGSHVDDWFQAERELNG